jgi:rRNA processing protein Krr1/Pno1
MSKKVFTLTLLIGTKMTIVGSFSTLANAKKTIETLKKSTEDKKVKYVVFESTMNEDGVVSVYDEKNKKKEKKIYVPSNYINYCSQFREKFKSEHPEFTFGQLAKFLGQKWRELSDEQKASYSLKSKE